MYRQTKHVQFLVFDRKDADLEHPKGKLRDVNSYFLLAYFFEVSQLFNLFFKSEVTIDKNTTIILLKRNK